MAEVAGTASPVASPPSALPASTADMAESHNGLASYPPPQARYEEVVASAGLFMETLARLHSLMGTKFKVPTIGGRALDLHRLFVEVTSRGGIEKVIRDRQWRDIIAMFNFPSTITSASFVLRKYYISLLQPYEQIYFFRNKGFDTSLDASQPTGALVASHSQVARTTSQMKGTERSPQGAVSPQAGQPTGALVASHSQVAITTSQMKGTERSPQGAVSPQDYSLQDGSLVTGTITGKFDHGYLVTANFGSERLTGILYHVPCGLPDQNTSYFNACERSKKKFRKAMKVDPSRPRSDTSGYNVFAEESTITRQIGHMWNNLTATEEAKGMRDNEQYMSEMLEYRRSFDASQPN